MQHTALESGQPVQTLILKDGGACSLGFMEEFNAALDSIEASAEPACLIITGEGKSFSTGFHLEEFFSGTAGLREAMFAQSISLLARVAALPLATAAALNGHTFGFGALLALACDYRFMRSDRGFFCLPELDLKVAIPRAMMELLKLKIRHDVLSDLLLTGRRIGGPEACTLGIVHADCPAGELLARTREAVLPLAGKDRLTLAAIKRELLRQFLDAAQG